MRYLITFVLFTLTCLSYSQEARYDSLQNINQRNYTQLVGQTLFYPKGEIVTSNLFWSNKKGKIYKPKDKRSIYSLNDAVLNKHFAIEKVISSPTPLLKTRISESNEVVYVNLDALFKNTPAPMLFVDGYIQKCKELYLNRHLYMDKTKYMKSLPNSFNSKEPSIAMFYCNNMRVTTIQKQGGALLLSDRATSSSPVEIDILDYQRAQISNSFAEEKIRQRIILLELEAKEKARKKQIADSIAATKLQQQQREDSIALVQMKEKYMNKTWYYRRGDWQYQRFKPIEVIDIQQKEIYGGRRSFSMKLLYKGTDYEVDYVAYIGDDGQCSFDEHFHNIPPEKEFPTVKHWNAVKKYKIVIGMNKQEVKLVWGIPTKINTSKGKWGVHEQWVYSSQFGTHYAYFENGKLTAIQD